MADIIIHSVPLSIRKQLSFHIIFIPLVISNHAYTNIHLIRRKSEQTERLIFWSLGFVETNTKYIVLYDIAQCGDIDDDEFADDNTHIFEIGNSRKRFEEKNKIFE